MLTNHTLSIGLRRIAGDCLRALLILSAIMLVFPAPDATVAAPNESNRPNVVLIVIDALRPDHLGCYGYHRPTSPNIDLLAERSVVFETAITQAPWTKGAFSSIFTSLYPFQHSVTDWESVMPDSHVTLPEILGEQGYDTRCVINMIGLGGRFGVLSGFSEAVEPEKKYRDARETTDIAIRMMREAEDPLFLLVHYFDPHDPYRPPLQHLDMILLSSDPDPLSKDPVKSREPGESRNTGGIPSDDRILKDMLMYDGCIRYTDHHIGRIVEAIDEMGLADNTLLIITADHGEAFWEHGAAGHGANVYDEAIRVPLIVHYPGASVSPCRVAEQVAHVDLLPTILEYAGITDEYHREGIGLLGFIKTGRRSRREGAFLPMGATLCECTVRRAPGTKCIRTDEWKLIVEPTTSLAELYDLENDHSETRNLWSAGVEIGASMMKRMLEIPGVSIQGWRLAFSGVDGSTAFEAEVSLPAGGRFSSIERLTRKKSLLISVSEDSTQIHIEASPEDLDLVHFDTTPSGSPVSFAFTVAGQTPPVDVGVGESSRISITAPFTLESADASGLPVSFQAWNASDLPRLHLWWLSGEEIAAPRAVIDLTPEEIKRLKSLGYLN
jgi:arylsulfatase A-like enzyme